MADLRAVEPPRPRDGHGIDEYRAAAVIAETLREQAALMPLNSEIRALALRSASRWSRIAQTRPLSLRLAPREED